ncbi:hypothetical protein [Mesorhizobium sp. 128a]
MMRPTPDADGVTRVFSKELWDDPKIGTFLREAGFAPDDQRNIMRTADDYIALFAAARDRLQQRTEAFNAEMAARKGYCRAAPFFWSSTSRSGTANMAPSSMPRWISSASTNGVS